MPALRIVLSMALVVILVGVATAEEKKKADNKDKISGKWQIQTRSGSGDLLPPVGNTVQFTKDGKVLVLDKDTAQDIGTYEVTGDMIKLNTKYIEDGKLSTKQKMKTAKIGWLADNLILTETGDKKEPASMELKRVK